MQSASPADRHVGLFGGSFNPPHLAHLIVAELIRQQFSLDRILWIPNYQSPFKQLEDVAPAEHRLEMTRLAIADHDAFELSDIEVHRAGLSYTVETIRLLQEQHPDVRFDLIIGSDSLETFGDWHQPEEILKRVRLLVFPRPGAASATPPAGFEHRVEFADAPLLEISGTAIRARIHAGQTVRYMIPDPVRDYIQEHRLYHPPPASPNS